MAVGLESLLGSAYLNPFVLQLENSRRWFIRECGASQSQIKDENLVWAPLHTFSAALWTQIPWRPAQWFEDGSMSIVSLSRDL